MTDILEKCARALCVHDGDHDPFPTSGYWHNHYMDAARAVIAALADGVTEEMAKLAIDVYEDQPRLIDHRVMRRALSAAIRAAIPEGKRS